MCGHTERVCSHAERWSATRDDTLRTRATASRGLRQLEMAEAAADERTMTVYSNVNSILSGHPDYSCYYPAIP